MSKPIDSNQRNHFNVFFVFFAVDLSISNEYDQSSAMEESEYETFIGRLNTFNDWPSEAPDYIKDLVEAGFVYTGQGYSVQCFRCHITVSEWKDEDKPLLVHEDLNKNCSYLRERRQKRASTLSLVPSADELNGREVVSQPQVNGHHIVEHQRYS